MNNTEAAFGDNSGVLKSTTERAVDCTSRAGSSSRCIRCGRNVCTHSYCVCLFVWCVQVLLSGGGGSAPLLPPQRLARRRPLQAGLDRQAHAVQVHARQVSECGRGRSVRNNDKQQQQPQQQQQETHTPSTNANPPPPASTTTPLDEHRYQAMAEDKNKLVDKGHAVPTAGGGEFAEVLLTRHAATAVDADPATDQPGAQAHSASSRESRESSPTAARIQRTTASASPPSTSRGEGEAASPTRAAATAAKTASAAAPPPATASPADASVARHATAAMERANVV